LQERHRDCQRMVPRVRLHDVYVGCGIRDYHPQAQVAIVRGGGARPDTACARPSINWVADARILSLKVHVAVAAEVTGVMTSVIENQLRRPRAPVAFTGQEL